MDLLIFPTQIFEFKFIKNIFTSHDINIIYIIEEPRYFTDFNFHKMKLIYHRSTMKFYFNYLTQKLNNKIIYVNFSNVDDNFYKKLNKVLIHNPIDNKLLDKLKKHIIELTIIESPNFLLTTKEVFDNKNEFYKNNKYYHDLFYKFQRKKLNILMNNNKPLGNKWSFDTDNRKKITHNINIPNIPKINNNNVYVLEAKKYISKYFTNNYGCDDLIYPINFRDSKKWLKIFLEKKLHNFGSYQDYMDDNNFLFHSGMSSMMNIGLLTDRYVVKNAYEFYNTHQKKIPLNSFEGFIRQVIGWRNYIYSIYLLEGKKMFNMNFLNHTNKINGDKLWHGIGIEPFDNIINKIKNTAYCHHIERLMCLGNMMLLLQINPKYVYKIFMEWTIDSYDWVMVPNVIGMSQHSCGDLMMTRVYFSSSNYILTMSNYKKDKWCDIWNILYYYFIFTHQKYLSKNYATSRQVNHWNKKTKTEQQYIIKNAQLIIKKILS